MILLLSFTPLSLALTRSNVWKSSLIGTRHNYALVGHVMFSRVAKGSMVCSQLCLSKPGCLSFNFKNRQEIDSEGLCELNQRRCHGDREVTLTPIRGYVYGEFVDAELKRYTFTSLGAQGPHGPTTAEVVGYSGTSLEGQVDIENGYQLWKVPISGTYSIEALGASGGNGTCQSCVEWKLGGLGARIKGTFYFIKDTRLRIVIGQQGLPTLTFPQRPGGGGGGTFVTLAIDRTKIIIAGGGGGGGLAKAGFEDGDPGQATQNGTRYGGHDGTGGQRFNTAHKALDNGEIKASSGAGYIGDGDADGNGNPAKSFLSGATGGFHAVDNGGFGGGGFGMTHGGGGGGYSGGGIIGSTNSGASGGGSSFNSGSHRVNEAGVNRGNGKVIITIIT